MSSSPILSFPKTTLETRDVLCNHLNEVLRLCEAVWGYVNETGRHKLDWSTISVSGGLPWSPSECQAIWRFIAYAWRPEDANNLTLDTSTLDGVESDMDDSVLFRTRNQVRSHLSDSPSVAPNASVPTRISAPTAAAVSVASSAPAPAASQSPMPPQQQLQQQQQPPAKRPRKTWSTDEDTELLRAVLQYGEGTWPTVRKATNLGRTSAQLSQRLMSIRKRVAKGSYTDPRVIELLGAIDQKAIAAASAAVSCVGPQIQI